MAWFPGIPVNAIRKYWQMPMSPKVKAVTITDLVKIKRPALFRTRIRQVTYKNMNDNNSFSHSKTPSARLIALIKDKPDTTAYPMAIGKIAR
jgi:hypothetical protein